MQKIFKEVDFMKFKNLVLTLGVLMMLAFTSMAAAAPSQVNRSMTAINAAKAEIPQSLFRTRIFML